jgi:hypothetical protein
MAPSSNDTFQAVLTRFATSVLSSHHDFGDATVTVTKDAARPILEWL